MTTANDLIEHAALKLGAKATGESLTADESNDSLEVLNSMLDALAIDGMMVYQIVQDSYTWAAAAASRTIGSSGDLNGTRPTKIEAGTYFRDSNNIDQTVDIIRDRATYDSLSSKSDTSTFPEILYYDSAYPLGTIYVYPVPSAQLTLKLNHWQILQSFAALTTDLALPRGYQWFIEHALAVALSPVFSVEPASRVVAEANRSKAALMRVNHRPVTSRLEVPFIGGQRSDIEAGV